MNAKLPSLAALLLAPLLVNSLACSANQEDKADTSAAPTRSTTQPAQAAAPTTSPARAPSATGDSTAVVQPGVPGGIFVETQTLISNVTAVDPQERTVTLATPDNKQLIVTCGPQVENFDQIRAGDQLKITVTEQLVIAMAPEGATPGEDAAGMIALAPKGAKPAGVVAGVVQVTATVTAIDAEKRKATLQFPDGSTRVVSVRPDVDLTQRKVGEKVMLRATEVVALSVEKP